MGKCRQEWLCVTFTSPFPSFKILAFSLLLCTPTQPTLLSQGQEFPSWPRLLLINACALLGDLFCVAFASPQPLLAHASWSEDPGRWPVSSGRPWKFGQTLGREDHDDKKRKLPPFLSSSASVGSHSWDHQGPLCLSLAMHLSSFC